MSGHIPFRGTQESKALTYQLKINLLRFLSKIKAARESAASCTCGRYYRLGLDPDLLRLIDLIEVQVNMEPETSRFELIETDDH